MPKAPPIRYALRWLGLRAMAALVAVSSWGCIGPRETASDGRPPRFNPWGPVRVASSPLPTDSTKGQPAPTSSAEMPPATWATAEPNASFSEEPGMEDEGATATEVPVYSACVAPLDATEPQYVLPYAVGDGYSVRQGTCGSVTHRGAFSYAYDFEMPRDSPVLAARGGVVVSIVEHHPEHTNVSSHANYVVLRHEDGQHSRYLHLKTEGVVVVEGDSVLAGDLIAYSGNSGRSSRPHLHFDVTMGCGRVSSRCPTLPVTFINAEDKALRGGRTYPALAF